MLQMNLKTLFKLPDFQEEKLIIKLSSSSSCFHNNTSGLKSQIYESVCSVCLSTCWTRAVVYKADDAAAFLSLFYNIFDWFNIITNIVLSIIR